MADALAELCADGTSLLVASTDLTHLDNYAEVVRIDRTLVDLVAAFDVGGLARRCGQSRCRPAVRSGW